MAALRVKLHLYYGRPEPNMSQAQQLSLNCDKSTRQLSQRKTALQL